MCFWQRYFAFFEISWDLLFFCSQIWLQKNLCFSAGEKDVFVFFFFADRLGSRSLCFSCLR